MDIAGNPYSCTVTIVRDCNTLSLWSTLRLKGYTMTRTDRKNSACQHSNINTLSHGE